MVRINSKRKIDYMINKKLGIFFLFYFFLTQEIHSDENDIYKKIDLFGEVLEKINKEYDLNQDGFIGSCVLYNTNILKSGDKTFDDIIELKCELDSINIHNCDAGTDQPILNLYFQNILKEFPDNMVTYWQRERNTSLILHFTHWFAPEKNNSRRGDRTIKEIYESNLSNFTKLSI